MVHWDGCHNDDIIPHRSFPSSTFLILSHFMANHHAAILLCFFTYRRLYSDTTAKDEKLRNSVRSGHFKRVVVAVFKALFSELGKALHNSRLEKKKKGRFLMSKPFPPLSSLLTVFLNLLTH